MLYDADNYVVIMYIILLRTPYNCNQISLVLKWMHTNSYVYYNVHNYNIKKNLYALYNYANISQIKESKQIVQ